MMQGHPGKISNERSPSCQKITKSKDIFYRSPIAITTFQKKSQKEPRKIPELFFGISTTIIQGIL